MSQHPSFGGKGKVKPKRNVRKRYERIRHLADQGKLQEDESVFGLPKTKFVE
ncbi:MAG TPA: small basic protein, partial [bacterium]|nr:small basic protein [bacterium]HPJ72104.1 small basic protein [bacterium]HPQ65451.1 small basic protein [bacterium]